MTAPSAWRPLSEAPKTNGAIVAVRRTYRFDGDLTVPIRVATCSGDVWVWNDGDRVNVANWEYAPIADTLELDRAVQVKVVEAFGVLLQAIVDAHSCVESLDDPHVILGAKLRKELRWAAVSGPRRAIEKFSTILHSAMGGRIPDEVSR